MTKIKNHRKSLVLWQSLSESFWERRKGMFKKILFVCLISVGLISLGKFAPGKVNKKGGKSKSSCVECHEKVTPGIVKQFLGGKMGKSGSVDCSDCHGSAHNKGKEDAQLKYRHQPHVKNATMNR
jgi:hypothetical protein